MLEYLTQEIRDGLVLARQRRARRNRLRVQIGNHMLPLVSLTHDSIVIDVDRQMSLRGYVDIYDGGRHIMHGLVIASRVEGGNLVCSFKQLSTVRETPPLDYWRDETRPAGYLPIY